MQTPRLVTPSIFLALALAGCGVAPTQEEVEQDVDQAVQSQAPAVPEQWSKAADSGTSQAGWIESFNDPALTALVIEAPFGRARSTIRSELRPQQKISEPRMPQAWEKPTETDVRSPAPVMGIARAELTTSSPQQ